MSSAAALRYRHGIDTVPVVLAAGRGDLADRIVCVARDHGVEVCEDASMAELLSRLPPGTEIPVEAYFAISQIIAAILDSDRPTHLR